MSKLVILTLIILGLGFRVMNQKIEHVGYLLYVIDFAHRTQRLSNVLLRTDSLPEVANFKGVGDPFFSLQNP